MAKFTINEYSVFLHNLSLNMFIGIDPIEQRVMQKVTVNCTISANDSESELTSPIDYAQVHALFTEIAKQRFGLLENLGLAILEQLAIAFADKQLTKVELVLSKPKVFASCEAAGVRLVADYNR